MYNKLVYYTLVIFIFIQLFFPLAGSALAQEYVLPYPSFMPGHPFYKFRLVLERVQEIWSFGNFSKFSYSLRQSDKYLIEAKTLFEYNQYLLATKALEKSNEYFAKTSVFLEAARREGKDTREKTMLLMQAANKHKEVLGELISVVPVEFNWQPEKREATVLRIKSALEESIKIRRNIE